MIGAGEGNDPGLVHFMDLRMPARVELGRQRVSLGAIRDLTSGDVLEFGTRAGAPLDLVVNGARVAQGEVVINNDRYGFRITRIYSVNERQRTGAV
jgi:flagellar motor switch protein FliN/FliY